LAGNVRRRGGARGGGRRVEGYWWGQQNARHHGEGEGGDGRDIRDTHHKIGKVSYNRQQPTSFVIVHTTTPTK